jgi:DNA-binding transcriptional ArsR family regulator
LSPLFEKEGSGEICFCCFLLLQSQSRGPADQEQLSPSPFLAGGELCAGCHFFLGENDRATKAGFRVSSPAEQNNTNRLTIESDRAIFNHMAEHPTAREAQRLDDTFRALADRTRRAMLRSLAERERSVGELAAPFAMSLAAASKHIKVLEHAGLVRRTVEGRTHRVRLDAQPMHAGLEWLRHYERYWNVRLDALDALLRAEDAAAKPVKRAVAGKQKMSRK